MLAVLKGMGKYPHAREALYKSVIAVIILLGRERRIWNVMPEGPGALRGERLRSRFTSSR